MLLLEQILDQRGRVEATAVRDGEGRPVGQVVPVARTQGRRTLLALTQASVVVAERYEVVDGTGNPVLRLQRPAPVFTPLLHVQDPRGRELGRIVTTRALGWDLARLQSREATLGALRAVSSPPESVVVVDPGAREVARISFEPQIHDPQAGPVPRRWKLGWVAGPQEPLRTLALAAALAADIVLVDPGRGIV